MPHTFADRVADIQPFRVMEVLDRAAELSSAGAQVVHFSVGEPDFATAEPIVDAGIAALQAGHTKYTSAVGILELRQAIAAFYKSRGLEVDYSRIVVTSGASAGLTLLNALLLNPGDELLITDPGYPCNEVFARLVGAVPKALPVEAVDQFQPTPEQVAQAWGAQTRGMLLASPANPTGTMLDAGHLQAITDLAQARDGFVILDEIYQGIVDASAAKYVSGLEICDSLYVLNSFSKYFGMTGWRLGWIVVPSAAIEAVTKLAQNLFISPSTPAQYAALAAFSPAALIIHEARVDAFAQRRKLLSDGLRRLGFSIPVLPEGAFYLYVDVSHTGLNSREFCWKLLDEFHVAVTPGEDFGTHHSDRYVRFAFTTGSQAIQLGLERIASALRAWGVN